MRIRRILNRESIVGVAFFGFSTVYLALGLRLKFGTIGNPGPGFLPLVIATCLLICSILYIVRSRRAQVSSESRQTDVSSRSGAPIYSITACTLLFPFALEWVGFFPATAGAACFMLISLQPRRVAWALVTAVLTALVAFMVFPIALGISVPFGVLDEFLYRLIRG
jgi:hypothetical protein